MTLRSVVCRYNISNFDLPYLINRAAALGLTKFPYWGRLRNKYAAFTHILSHIVLPRPSVNLLIPELSAQAIPHVSQTEQIFVIISRYWHIKQS